MKHSKFYTEIREEETTEHWVDLLLYGCVLGLTCFLVMVMI